MIIIVHNNNNLIRVEKYIDEKYIILDEYQGHSLVKVLFQLSKDFSESKIAWCLEKLYIDTDWDEVERVLQHPMKMFSYHPSEIEVFDEIIHYANFLSTTANNIPKDVRFPTWIMSEAIGIMHAKLIIKYAALSEVTSFQVTLNAISKLGTSKGVLHYSEPKLCSKKYTDLRKESLLSTLSFIKSYMGVKWAMYTASLYLYEQKSHFLTLVRGTFSKKTSYKIDDCSDLYDALEYIKVDEEDTVDVLIPTLGRKDCLRDVLNDLCEQTLIPKNVIIVEQHPDEEVKSELGYIYTQQWPFEIKHSYIHQLGACNARNVGLRELESKWMFAADDDIRLKPDMLKNTISFMKTVSIGAVSIATYLPSQSEKKFSNTPYMFDSFASGASVVNQEFCRTLKFDMAFEFGYGEDTAYGCELRKRGCDVVYYPQNAILHLKAPMGGFRFKFEHLWNKEEIQPKPSPSVMYFYQKYMNAKQIFAYKVFLFFSLVKTNKTLNLFSFAKKFNKRWQKSIYWSEQIKKNL